MTAPGSFTCACCDQEHDGFPAIGFDAPVGWDADMADRPGWSLTSDECVINGEDFFVRAVLRIPVLDAEQDFEWGVWVSQSETNFRRARTPWNRLRPTRLSPTFGWLSNELAAYEESTLALKTTVRPQPRGLRPLVQVERSEHPLSLEQCHGITTARVHELVAPYLT